MNYTPTYDTTSIDSIQIPFESRDVAQYNLTIKSLSNWYTESMANALKNFMKLSLTTQHNLDRKALNECFLNTPTCVELKREYLQKLKEIKDAYTQQNLTVDQVNQAITESECVVMSGYVPSITPIHEGDLQRLGLDDIVNGIIPGHLTGSYKPFF